MLHHRTQKLVTLALALFVIAPVGAAAKKAREIVVVGSKVKAAPKGSAASASFRECIYPLCGGDVIEERDGTDTLTRQIVYAGRTPLWQVRGDGSSQYLHEDPRGNVVMLTEGTGLPTASPGDVLERVTYDAYGKPVFQTATNQDKLEPGSGNFRARSDFGNTLLFMGHWYDPETGSRGGSAASDFGGQYEAGGRYFNPDEGRFTTRALEGDPDRPLITGRYAFAGHTPVNSGGPMPQTREHVLLARQVGVPLKKVSGYRTVGDITLKRGIFRSTTGEHQLHGGHADYVKTLYGTRDAGSGLPTGKRQHKPLILVKPMHHTMSKKLFVGGLSWDSTDESGNEHGEYWF